jgi:hypothetical protein
MADPLTDAPGVTRKLVQAKECDAQDKSIKQVAINLFFIPVYFRGRKYFIFISD